MLDKVLNTPVIMEVCLRSLQYLESLGSSVVFFLGGGGGEGRRGLIFFHYTEAKAKRLNGSFSKMRLCLIIDYQLRQKLQVIQQKKTLRTPLTHFVSRISFYTPNSIRKLGFLMFSGGIESDQWHKIGSNIAFQTKYA